MTPALARSLPGHSQLAINTNQALKRALATMFPGALLVAAIAAKVEKERNERY